MASGNRVEELESRVRQLEASVTGLTDELVECKERIQALEAEVDPPDAVAGRSGRANRPDPPASESEGDKSERDQEGEQSGSSGSDEIIVA
ncbi:bZIP transcription factor [Halomarina halobia]|uniref:BZIP transcription factor n=1 Tax=Halomarina halobia TaxID=3033386 RepID=A0ABD6ACI7_9EURY|nr:bZIP transcription factor [Halomarina sp. PSR21]